MNPVIVGPLVELIKTGIDRIWPDKGKQAKERAEAERVLKQLAIDAEEKIAAGLAQSDAGQVEINKIEAASDSLFKSGWRPGAGWICVTGLGYTFLAQPLLVWMSSINGWPAPPPLDTADLFTLLMGLLGLGAYRTYEKRARVA